MARRSLTALLQMMRGAENARFLSRRAFADQLEIKLMQNAGRYTSLDARTLKFEYRVPERVCTGGDKTLPVTTLMAIMDEVTTWTGVALDPCRRPGVSISMNTQLLQEHPVRAGDLITFSSSLQKLGRTLGFLECVMENEQGRVARGTHVKYLEMGRTWDLLFGDRLFPLTKAVLRLASSSARPAPALATALSDILRLRPLQEAGSGNAAQEYALHCGPDHMNEFGVLHGGCQAVLHGAAGDEVHCLSEDSSMLLHDAQVTYMAPGRPGPVRLRVAPLLRTGARAAYLSTLMSESNSRVLSQAILHYCRHT